MTAARNIVLLVSNRLPSRQVLEEGLEPFFEIHTADSLETAASMLRTIPYKVALLDLGEQNCQAVSYLRAIWAGIALAAVQGEETGEYRNPTRMRQLVGVLTELFTCTYDKLREEVARLRAELERKYSFGGLSSNNPRMQRMFYTLEKVANTDATILIEGESGTGKERVARAIHYSSNRGAEPFVAVNCAAIPETLLESELFGYERGAFTGATERRKGKFEQADGGTLFLDEVGSMSLAMQAKVLRALQEREFQRVGGQESIRVYIRVVAATNKSLKEAVAREVFREDLYYRLNVIPVVLPPLRERREDIPLLIEQFIDACNEQFGTGIRGITPPALTILEHYRWPGNIRELENTIQRMALLAESTVLDVNDIPAGIGGVEEKPPEGHSKPAPTPLKTVLGMLSHDIELKAITAALDQCDWNISRTARVLGLTRKTLYRKIRQFDLRRAVPDYDA